MYLRIGSTRLRSKGSNYGNLLSFMYYNIMDGKFFYLKGSTITPDVKSSNCYKTDPGHYPLVSLWLTKLIEMSTNKKIHINRIVQQISLSPPFETSLRHYYIQCRSMLRGEEAVGRIWVFIRSDGPYFPCFLYDIDRKHVIWKFSDNIQNNPVDDTKSDL